MPKEVIIHPIFPQPIYCSTLGRTLTEDELKVIDKFKPTNYDGDVTQQSSDNYILERKELKNLKEDLNKMIIDYFNKIVSSSNLITPYITQSWINYTGPHKYHRRHSHPNSYISGVFYISADPKVDKIKFYKRDYERIEVECKKFNQFNAASWYFQIKTGDVLLFPSSLEHAVEIKKGTNLRISLSFNIFLKGHIGATNKLTRLMLHE